MLIAKHRLHESFLGEISTLIIGKRLSGDVIEEADGSIRPSSAGKRCFS